MSAFNSSQMPSPSFSHFQHLRIQMFWVVMLHNEPFSWIHVLICADKTTDWRWRRMLYLAHPCKLVCICVLIQTSTKNCSPYLWRARLSSFVQAVLSWACTLYPPLAQHSEWILPNRNIHVNQSCISKFGLRCSRCHKQALLLIFGCMFVIISTRNEDQRKLNSKVMQISICRHCYSWYKAWKLHWFWEEWIELSSKDGILT